MNMKRKLLITKIIVSQKDFLENKTLYPDDRILDSFTKRALYTAESLFQRDFSGLNPDRTGVVLSTRSGVYKSIKEAAEVIKEKGYRGMNPSRFPNVMLSTALSRLTILCNVHGPSCVFYDEEDYVREAMEYCKLQIESENSEAMILICTDETGNSEGYFIREEGIA